MAGGSNPPGRATRISDGYAPFASNRLFLFWLRLEFCHPLVTHVQWLRLAHLVGILLCARSFPPRGALCDHRRHLVHRSMRARPFAGAARPGERFPPSPLSPLTQKLASMVLRHCSLLLRLRVLFRPPSHAGLSTPKNRGIFLEIFRGNPGRFSGAVASAAPRLHARPLTDNNATEVIQ